MAITINTNTSASYTAANITRSSDLLQRSLARLSSGSRIANPQDDAGGLAVTMKMSAAIKRTDAQAANVSNALSFLQTQAGSLRTASSVLDRLSELATLYNDVTKSSNDKQNYQTEYDKLITELGKIANDSFNGITLFNAGTTVGSLTVFLTEDSVSSSSMTISQSTLANLTANIGTISTTGDVGNVANITTAIQDLATMMATNGAESSRLQFALDALNTNKVNLEAANSRIYDVDVAAETTKLARANILVQSGAAMLAQANAASQIALKLLQ
jgi:flagellin